MNDNWINVKTNPPKDHKTYLVGWVKRPIVEKMIWTLNGWYWPPNRSLFQGKVDPDHEPTHYQELPEPPTEESGEVEVIPKLGGFICPHCKMISAYNPDFIKEIKGE